MQRFYYSQRPYQNFEFNPINNGQQTAQSPVNGEQFRNTPPSSSISQLVTQHCNIIKEKAEIISTDELTNTLDKLLREIKQFKNQQQSITNLHYIITTLILVNRSTLASVVQHNFFTLLRAPLIQLIQQWHRDFYLNEDDLFIFRTIISLLKRLLNKINEINLYPSWLFDPSLLNAVAACLRDISKSDKFLHEKNKHASKGFIHLLSIYITYQKHLSDDKSSNKDSLVQLIDSAVHCLTSKQYIDLFEQMQTKKKLEPAQRKLFFDKCPSFLISYNGSRLEQIMDSLLSTMLPQYNTLFNKLIPLIDQWKHSTIRAVNYLIKIVNHGPANRKILADHLSFIDHMLTLVDTPVIYNNVLDNFSNVETNLMNTAVSFLANMINEPAILAYIKQKKMTPSFLRLTSARYEPLVYSTYNVLALITTEEDISKMRNPDVLLSTVTESLRAIMTDQNSDKKNQVGQLLEILKGLTQHDQIKEAVLKQGTLTFLLDCINKLTGEALILLLETLWSLSFSQTAAIEIRANPAFLEKIQTISKNTNNEELKKASDGLVWKLVQEPVFLEKIANRQQKEQETAEETFVETTEIIIGPDGKEQIITKTKRASIAPAEQVFQYDIMISYCHADQDLIRKIHKFLVDQGFKIWIDLNNMFGPAMSAMAEAVENCEFVIMCMSDSYKQSTYCQAEAEYAFGCKRRLLPLIVRPGYKPDGWLGFMIGSRIYVDFGRYDFDTACDKLMNEISLQRKRPLPSKVAGAVLQHEIPAATAPVVQTIVEKPSTPPLTLPDKYMKRNATFHFNQIPMYRWNELDVLDFFYKHHLYEIMPLCEKMDGGALIQLYKMCISHTNGTFSLLNDELQSTLQMKLPIGIYTRFLSIMERTATLPSRPPPPPIVASLPPPPPPIAALPPPPPPPIAALPPPSMPALIQPLYIPLPPIENRSSVQTHIEDSNSIYDIVITSDAPVSQMLRIVERLAPQVKSMDSKHRRRTIYL